MVVFNLFVIKLENMEEQSLRAVESKWFDEQMTRLTEIETILLGIKDILEIEG